MAKAAPRVVRVPKGTASVPREPVARRVPRVGKGVRTGIVRVPMVASPRGHPVVARSVNEAPMVADRCPRWVAFRCWMNWMRTRMAA